jgi:hypothetical protein
MNELSDFVIHPIASPEFCLTVRRFVISEASVCSGIFNARLWWLKDMVIQSNDSLAMVEISGVPPIHEYCNPVVYWNDLVDIGWEERLDGA